jgi:hypothetical protein
LAKKLPPEKRHRAVRDRINLCGSWECQRFMEDIFRFFWIMLFLWGGWWGATCWAMSSKSCLGHSCQAPLREADLSKPPGHAT